MKRIIVFLCALVFILFSTSVSKASPSGVIINSYQGDVNGDGKVEEIVLKGIPFSDQRDYYYYIWAEIEGQENQWKINYGDGYEPDIQLIDTNHDRILDILYQDELGPDKKGAIQKLHTLSNDQVEEIRLPKLNYVSAKFEDQFKVLINYSPYEKPREIDVEKHSDIYIQANLYSEDGTLKRQKYLSINDVSFFEPVKLSNQKGFGLRSYKHVYGISNEDQIGTIETLWYFNDGNWKAVQSEWIEPS